jgi:serine/threonine-protein kinase
MTTEPAGKSPKRPLRVGRYEVLRHIASGGMGTVYRAVDTESGRDIALKVLSPDLATNPKVLERFRREARAASRLRHENIVAVYEFGEHAGTHFLALEFIDGVDLQDYIKERGKLSPDEARDLLKQAVKALAHLHSQGIVHRDIKPSNFLITQIDGRTVLKLTDLGLARQARESEGRVTRDGTTVGTVDYMSPEQANDAGSADIRSDLYSLGCTFFHMLAGHAPFHEGTLIERLTQHVNAEPPDVRKSNPDVPDELVHVLERLLRKRPQDRYQAPLDVLRDLLNPNQIDLTPRLAPLDPPQPRVPRPPREPRSATVATPKPTLDDSDKLTPVQIETKSIPPGEAAATRKPRPASKRPIDDPVTRKTDKRVGVSLGVLAAVGAALLFFGAIVVIFLLVWSRP